MKRKGETMLDKIKSVVLKKVDPSTTLEELMACFEQEVKKQMAPEPKANPIDQATHLQAMAKQFLEEEKRRREEEAKGAEKLYAYFGLNDEEKMAAGVALTQGIVEAQAKFVSLLEEVDSFVQSLDEMLDLNQVDINKVLNCILSDTEKVGGFGYAIRVKSLEER